MRLPDLRRIAQIAMARSSREAMFEVLQRHYIKICQANFLLCYVKHFKHFKFWHYTTNKFDF